MAISLLTIPLVSSLEINLDSPSSVKINEEFTVKINVDSTDLYDVKIFVHKSDDNKISSDEYISEIYKDDWSNPWYYILESFPDKKDYQIRVVDSPGDRTICARLRKTNTKSAYTECNPINVLAGEVTDETNEETTEETPDQEPPRERITEEQPDAPPEIKEKSVPLSIKKDTTEEKIILNSPKQEEQKTISTKQEKTRTLILYSFIGICVFIIILLALRKL